MAYLNPTRHAASRWPAGAADGSPAQRCGEVAPSCSNGFRTKSAVSPPPSLVPGPQPATAEAVTALGGAGVIPEEEAVSLQSGADAAHHPGDAPPHVEPWSSDARRPGTDAPEAGEELAGLREPVKRTTEGVGDQHPRRDHVRSVAHPVHRVVTASRGARRGPRRTPPAARRDAGQNPVPFHDRRRYTEPAGQSFSAHGGGSTYSGSSGVPITPLSRQVSR